MKKIFYFIFLLKTAFCAQLAFCLEHNNRYSIASNGSGVPAKIYILFLNEKVPLESLRFYQVSKYWDSSFMTPSGIYNPQACIQASCGFLHYYQYSLIPGHEEDVINDVDLQVYGEFNNWANQWWQDPVRSKNFLHLADADLNLYPIGNHDITAKVYALFLQSKDGTFPFWDCAKYYGDDVATAADAESERAYIQRLGEVPNFTYAPISGHENDVIEGVPTAEVQNEFNRWYADWMKNPTRQEVCDYINDKLQGHFDSSCEEAGNQIAARYPNATSWQSSRQECPVFDKNGCSGCFLALQLPLGTVFNLADLIVQENYNTISFQGSNLDTSYSGNLYFNDFNRSYGATASYDAAALGHSQLVGACLFNLPRLSNHSDYDSWFNKMFSVEKIITFQSTETANANSLPTTAALADPATGWERDTSGWNLVNVKYDVPDAIIQ